MANLFGKYAVVDTITHQFEDEPQWYWKIKPITSGLELEMSKFLAHKRILTTQAGRTELPPTAVEIGFREIALTFGGTNIPADPEKPVEEGGEPLIPENLPIEQIEEKLKVFPRSMFMEIWRAIGEASPYWGPADPNQD